MEAAASFDWGTVALFYCVIDWPQGRGSHLAGFLAQFIHRPWMEGERNEGRAARFCEQTQRSQRWEMTSGSHPSVGGRGGNKVGWLHHHVSREERLKCLFAGGRCMLGIK